MNQKAIQIFKDEFQKNSVAILAEAVQGKSDTLEKAVEKAFTDTCVTGAKQKATNMLKDWRLWAGIGGAGVLGYGISRATKRKRR